MGRGGRSILTHVDEVVYVVGASEENPLEGTVELVSDRAREITGYAPKEFYEDPGLWLSLIHPDDLEGLRESTLKALASRSTATREYRLRNRETGEYRWIEDRFAPRVDRTGRLTGFIGAARDVTERRRSQEELLRSQRWLQALFDNALEGMLLADDEARYVDANPAACALTGYGREELLRMTVYDVTPALSLETGRDLWRAFIAAGKQSGERALRRKDGSTVEVEYRAVAHIVPGLHLSILADITERKRAEEALRHLSSRLIQLQDEERRRIARELHDSTGQILAALAMKLSAIGRAASRWRSATRKALAESQALAEQSAREIRTLSYLLHPPLLDEAGLVSALRWLVDGFTERSGIHTVLDVGPDLGRLAREAETSLFRVVQESLVNVHRHSGSATAAVRLFRDRGEAVLEVEDHGRGIAPDGDQADSGSVTLGVGIAGMRERIRELGGSLQVHSGAAGTTVRVVLPFAESPR